MKIKIHIILIVLTLSIQCDLPNHAKDNVWEYSSGFHIGDVLDFEHSAQYKLEDSGKILVNGKFRAKIVSADWRELIIVSKRGKRGVYVSKDL